MRARWIVPFALVPLACSEGPAAPHPEARIEVHVAADGIVIENLDDEARWHILIERETAALVDLNLNPEGQEHWIRIAAGESRLVPWSAIFGFEPGARAVVVYSWVRSVPLDVGGGIQWVAEGFRWLELEL